MNADTKIMSKASGNAVQVLAWAKANGAKRIDFLTEYLNTLYEVGEKEGINADLAAVQSSHETGDASNGAPWSSPIWQSRGNPAGLGVTDGGDQGISFKTGAEAAKAQLAHLRLYATGQIDGPVLKPSDDPRYQAYRDAYGTTAKATTLNGLAGTWATDKTYATQITAKAAKIFPTSTTPTTPTSSLVFGKVPHPAYKNREAQVADKPVGVGWDDLGQRHIYGVVLHRMVGSLLGTDSYFGDPSVGALTDYGVGVLARDGADLDGVIYRWNNPLGRRAGWASGPVKGAYGDGLAFVNKYGINAVNRDQVSIEISGDYDTPLSAKAKQSIVALVAYYADQAQISWSDFPIWKKDGFSFIRWHQEFTIGTGKICPGPVVMNATNELIAMVVTLLKKYQVAATTTPSTPSYAKPVAIPDVDGDDHVVDNTTWYALQRNVKVANKDGAECYSYASLDAPKTRKKMARGTKFRVVFSLQAAGIDWYVTENGSRVRMSDCSPKAQLVK